MVALLPSLQVGRFRQSISDYLDTTFALADREVAKELDLFLSDERTGIFRGPYIRTRMPFKAAERDAHAVLEWYGAAYPPHGHQLAAFERLSSARKAHFDTRSALLNERSGPLPTLVTTGTGSGKTEAFLFPIIDHVLRAQKAGESGLKALILYPMNALANDQARRLAKLITEDPQLAGISAGLYIGEQGAKPSKVNKDGLITDRGVMRAKAPDILLTNYKMLDQLLLRPDDQSLWKQSATSLQYLVLDEFHTYDGAQGTDVAMLLRRLGLALKRNWPTNPAARKAFGIDDAAEAAPLGKITPVATSATLGGDDPMVMVDFANTVFGGGFDASSVVSETRHSVEEWAGAAELVPAGIARTFGGVGTEAIDAVAMRAAVEGAGDGPLDIAREVVAQLYAEGEAGAGPRYALRALRQTDGERATRQADQVRATRPTDLSAKELHDALRVHPTVQQLLRHTASPISLKELVLQLHADALTVEVDAASDIVNAIVAAISQVRAAVGFSAPSVDVNAWIREVTRIDRVAGPTVAFRWTDDGEAIVEEGADAFSEQGRDAWPALYCRHCGRSGWGVSSKGTGEGRDLEKKEVNPRETAVKRTGTFRALIYADREADQHYTSNAPVPGFGWWDVPNGRVFATHPDLAGDERDHGQADSNILPVRWLDGEDASKESNSQTCPACGRRDGIRFMGAAVATMLSVVTTALFGDGDLDEAEKKELVFTDSVQDAAHRAGFVQSRAHTFGLRNAIRRALGDQPRTLDELSTELVARAQTRSERYRLLGPDIVERESFRSFWDTEDAASIDVNVRLRVAKRLAFDLQLEFGLQSSFARTLERTGSVTVEVVSGSATLLERLARDAVTGFEFDAELGADGVVSPATLVAWARGTLEELRSRGGIYHQWLKTYIADSGMRYRVWGGRPKAEGMPAFPRGRSAPAFARVGANPKQGKVEFLLDDLASPQGWYARWTSRLFGVPKDAGGRLARRLFESLAEGGLLDTYPITRGGGSHAFGITPDRILVSPASAADREAGNTMLECDRCGALTAGSPTTVAQLAGSPCPGMQCEGGTLQRHALKKPNFYRSLYEEADMRRVVAREHTSLLPDDVRLAYEGAFKSTDPAPDAPNVLVATPTLEMGIDIGDLSTVVLASLPQTVASYVQRVGRAGRLSGSALALAFVPGRHDQLAWYQDPLELIDGEVTPPATYLDAGEILKRQFLAAVFDQVAADGGQQAVRLAKDVLLTDGPGTPLGDIREEISTRGEELLERFLRSFGVVEECPGVLSQRGLREDSIQSLRDWLQPDERGMVPVHEDLSSASRRFASELEGLSHRLNATTKAIAELQDKVDGPAPTEEDKDELRAAKATMRMLARTRQDLEGMHWVSALERAGILPNYTLLDDSVTLDVGVSWIDADTQEFHADSFTYSRDARNAIREFAPGATFYAQGLEIEIDSVETGANGEAVHDWACCPRCGYVEDLTAASNGLATATTIGPCPRCGEAAFADKGQRLHVIELEKVSAQVRRDEHLISDSSDDRVRSFFTSVELADFEPKNVLAQWFEENTGIAVKYLREVTLRTLNLGSSGESAGGVQRILGGNERQAPLFRVCRECGQLDTQPGENSWREHRPWCSHRKNRDEDPVNVALSRTLTTQGMLVRLPEGMAAGDPYVLPSLAAALRLGLRKTIGGDPSHLDIAAVQDVSHSGLGTATFDSLLVHDRVPGGTGYLADHATRDGLERILLAALDVVEACPCADERRSACHRCLLPFAPPGATKSVWRETAVRVLRQLLGWGRDAADAAASRAAKWQVVEEDPGKVEAGSALEQLFRKALLVGLQELGASVTQQPGTYGNSLTVTMPSQPRRTVRPEVNIANARADFFFESENAADGKLAVFLDGMQFHATQAVNRLAEDARKREEIRALPDVSVISLTWDDVQDFLAGVPTRVPELARSRPTFGQLGALLGLNAGDTERLFENPMRRILDWMRNPRHAREAWSRILPALPTLMIGPDTAADLGGRSVTDAALALLDGPLPAGGRGSAQIRDGAFVAVTAYVKAGPVFETALVLDDSNDALASVGFREQWREYLHWGNVLGFDAEQTVISTRSLLSGEPVVAGEAAGAAPARAVSEAEVPRATEFASTGSAGNEREPALSAGRASGAEDRPGGRADIVFATDWSNALEYALDEEKTALAPLLESGVVPPPVVGDEAAAGVLVLALWKDEHLVFAPELGDEELQLVTSAGYDVRDADGVIGYFNDRVVVEQGGA
ncbi:DEAD/DEAH box helicase [Gulosibacter molinativorax]|uniref:DUF1998 domain-containing protein n=1 Tax=Gulosibacter molinativorax TaxID=256821 RepID=A0ABT7C5G6_9MICO|nr:DEAD/DEAH box helicase [Gulosibacter molinativorax]MDJ1369931.1 DUF1998 domain-containing protein [Gulosibacter molinativorax]QUY61901.1 Putative ATP-dependent helicase hrq1 [Gulosibacter molinativorax]